MPGPSTSDYVLLHQAWQNNSLNLEAYPGLESLRDIQAGYRPSLVLQNEFSDLLRLAYGIRRRRASREAQLQRHGCLAFCSYDGFMPFGSV